MSQQGDARSFVQSLDLGPAPDTGRRGFDAGPPAFLARPQVDQAAVVGGQLQAFVHSVEPQDRETLQGVMLLAQLHAKRHAPVDDAHAWYDDYFNTLNRIGLLVEEQTFRTSDTGTVEADVEKVVLELAASLLGGVATTAFKVVEATLAALQRLQDDSPAVTIFRRETQRENARFQVSVVQEVDGRLAVDLLAFTLALSATSTQVLFFKSRAESARMRHVAASLAVVPSTLDDVAPLIADKVADHVSSFVKQLAI